MSTSPTVSVRLPDGLYAKLTAAARKSGKTHGQTARDLLAKALGAKRLTEMQRRGRKKLSEIP